jgi:hypothetical protein
LITSSIFHSTSLSLNFSFPTSMASFQFPHIALCFLFYHYFIISCYSVTFFNIPFPFFPHCQIPLLESQECLTSQSILDIYSRDSVPPRLTHFTHNHNHYARSLLFSKTVESKVLCITNITFTLRLRKIDC